MVNTAIVVYQHYPDLVTEHDVRSASRRFEVLSFDRSTCTCGMLRTEPSSCLKLCKVDLLNVVYKIMIPVAICKYLFYQGYSFLVHVYKLVFLRSHIPIFVFRIPLYSFSLGIA